MNGASRKSNGVARDDAAIMSPAQASRFLGVSIDTIYAALHRQALPHKRLGRRIIILRDELEAWLRK